MNSTQNPHLKHPNPSSTLKNRLADWIPQIVFSPTLLITLIFVHGFIFLTLWLSFSSSKLLPVYDWIGFRHYERLFESPRWWVALSNLGIFGGLFISIALFLGLLLAIFLDQRLRFENTLRSIYFYPMALSFIVTGVIWQWILKPGLGIESFVRSLGFESFRFDWIIQNDMAIYTVVIAAVWQSTGFSMAFFLAGLRRIDSSIIQAAQIDGASLPRIYLRIIIPSLAPVFFSTLIILSHLAIKSFDLVIALTSGGPGYSTDLPAIFMYEFSFQRNSIGYGSASSIIMLGAVLGIVIPYLYSELRKGKQ